MGRKGSLKQWESCTVVADRDHKCKWGEIQKGLDQDEQDDYVLCSTPIIKAGTSHVLSRRIKGRPMPQSRRFCSEQCRGELIRLAVKAKEKGALAMRELENPLS